MSIIDDTGKAGVRRPSLRKLVMQDVSRGSERTRAWPRGRGKITDETTLHNMDMFRQAQWATKYWDPRLQYDAAQAVAGTPLLPRDLMTMMMFNRLASLKLDDGRELFPLVARKDVSESLDLLTNVPGSMIYRGPDLWQPVLPGPDGWVLQFDDATKTPRWAASAGAVGGPQVAWWRCTNGTNPVAGTWSTRPMNLLDLNEFGAVMSGSNLTLPVGRYMVEGEAQATRTNGNRLRLRDVTNNVTRAWGVGSWSGTATGTGVGASSPPRLFGKFELTAPATFAVQTWSVAVSASFSGQGQLIGAVGGETTVDSYVDVRIFKYR